MGDLVLKGATSGQITLTPTAIAGTNTLTLPAKTGNIITSADSGTVTGTMLASATVAPSNLSTGGPSWTSGGVLSFNSGYGSTATAYGCRAWATFTGTGSSPITPLASGNVSSITKSATGSYTVNFAVAMPDANYTTVPMFQPTASNNGSDSFAISPTTTSVEIRHFEVGTQRDGAYCCVLVIR
jgi:hypothetical protein